MKININKLNQLVGEFANRNHEVNSYYNIDVYNIWNTTEVKYGSVVFNIISTTLNGNTKTINALLYYGDRLTEDKSNRDSIYSDTVKVINNIIEDFNEVVSEVEYPLNIEFFEQSFADSLAGGYCNISFNVAAEIC